VAPRTNVRRPILSMVSSREASVCGASDFFFAPAVPGEQAQGYARAVRPSSGIFIILSRENRRVG
jgi:hypothetical protein